MFREIWVGQFCAEGKKRKGKKTSMRMGSSFKSRAGCEIPRKKRLKFAREWSMDDGSDGCTRG